MRLGGEETATSEVELKGMKVSFDPDTHTATVSIGNASVSFCLDRPDEARTCIGLVSLIDQMKTDLKLATGWRPDFPKWRGAFFPYGQKA